MGNKTKKPALFSSPDISCLWLSSSDMQAMASSHFFLCVLIYLTYPRTSENAQQDCIYYSKIIY